MNQASTIPQKTTIEKFTATIEQYENKNLLELLEGCNMTPAQFKQIVINEISKSPSLQKAFLANPASLLASVLTCAELQLNPSQIIGEFYFSVQDNIIIPILGYKGLITLLMRSNKVKKIWTEVVYEGDDFEYELGLEPKLFHIPNHDAARTADKIKFVYACAKLDDEVIFNVMSKKEIKAVADMPKNPSNLYFNDKLNGQRWMEKKTVLKQLGKLMPKSDDRVKAGIALDDNVEGGGYLILDENDNVKLIQKNIINKKSNIYDKLRNSSNPTLIE
jgi:recombination protein RecT